MTKILIIGKTPPPIGGVTIHVNRLLEILKYKSIDFDFYDLKHFSIFSFIVETKKHDLIHLHASSPYLRLLFCFICKFLSKQSIITYHGDLGRFNIFSNYVDFLSVKHCKYPIVLNDSSLNIALKYNKNSKLLSAYIPPIKNEKLNEYIIQTLSNFRKRFSFIISTNAFNYTIDKNGVEIYGISELIEFFYQFPKYGFVISDPSGNYKKRYPSVSDNILIINTPHPFYKVLDYADCFIRYTSTDGDSLSIHEALEQGIPVIATDVVSRPSNVYLIHRGDNKELKKAIDFISSNFQYNKNKKENNNNELIDFYKQLLAIQ